MATDGDGDWSNVRFRPRRVGGTATDGDAAARFAWGAILFVAVALAYPWYAYWVQSYLLERDARRALTSIDRDLRAMEARLPDAFDEPPMQAPRRTPSPRILGIGEGATTSVIVADLDGAHLHDVESQLCAGAARWTRRPVTGRAFRVQRYLGTSPAITVGVVRC
ncbi:MAG TPA: hypothetical protein VFE72_11750 [Lysobacter sp.]|nr:hypothetical protein [Lysobacter sp.]